MHKEAVYAGRSKGDFKNDRGEIIQYDNHLFEVMGGRVKVRTSDVEVPADLIEGEPCALEYGVPRYRKAGNYLDMYLPISAVHALTPAEAVR